MNYKTILSCLLVSTPLLIAACDDVTDSRIGPPSDVTLLIKTNPETPSHCLVKNDKGDWALFLTPGYIDIHRDKAPVEVTCDNNLGWYGHIIVPSNLDSSGIIDSIMAGGITSAAVAAISPPAGVAAIVGAGLGVGFGVNAQDEKEGRSGTYQKTIVVPMHLTEADPIFAVGHAPDLTTDSNQIQLPAKAKPKKTTNKNKTHKTAKNGGEPTCQCQTNGTARDNTTQNTKNAADKVSGGQSSN